MKTPVAAFAALAILGLVAVPQAFAAGQSGTPKITEVEYSKDKESLNRSTDVQVEGRRIESLKIKARFRGDTAKADTVQDRSISGRPWVLDYHDRGRRDLLNLMEDSIAATGAVILKLIAKNDAGTTKESVEIVFSECHMDPPVYPFTCIVEP